MSENGIKIVTKGVNEDVFFRTAMGFIVFFFIAAGYLDHSTLY